MLLIFLFPLAKVNKLTFFFEFNLMTIAFKINLILGKAKPLSTRTTVYKKTDDFVYQLKMKASRTFFSEAQLKFGSMPFSLRLFEDEVKAKMGVVECERHGLLTPYQVNI